MILKIIEFPSPFTFPPSNLALDHSLFIRYKPSSDIWIRHWVNSKSVILGKGQKLEEEVDITMCKKMDVGIYRRMSGGGTVFHDLGNLNISLIMSIHGFKKKSIPGTIDFVLHLVVSTLEELFPKDSFSIRGTNIFKEDKKISGSASYKKGNKLLFHFTLLVDVNLETMKEVLLARDPNPASPWQSRYAPTTNLHGFDINKWRSGFFGKLLHSNPQIAPVKWDNKGGIIMLQQIEEDHYRVGSLNTTTMALSRFLEKNLYLNNDWIQTGRWARIYNWIRRRAEPELGYNPF